MAGKIYPKRAGEASGDRTERRSPCVDEGTRLPEVQGVSDGIIDLTAYLQKRDDETEEAGTFALWGAEGERSRFALPLWRTIYLAGGERGGILRIAAEAPGQLDPFVVLDLAQDPARTDFDLGLIQDLDVEEAPVVRDAGSEGLAVFLGFGAERFWYLMVEGRDGEDVLDGRSREDVLFMAGECAGLLFLRELADEELP